MNIQKIFSYLTLIRFQKPIGTLLLLWPALAALWLASMGTPSIQYIVVFALGCFVVRSLGCIVNDFADRNLDGKVERTKNRPLATGQVSVFGAGILFFVLCVVALVLVWQLNTLSIYIAIVALLLTCIYPFLKRFTHLPQAVLGLAFSCSILMAFAAVQNQLPALAWILFVANTLFTIAYDTAYAMVDRNDDIQAGIKSTARLFGRLDVAMIIFLQSVAFLTWVGVGWYLQFKLVYFLCLLCALVNLMMQWRKVATREREKCFKAFLSNHVMLMFIWVGVMLVTL